MGSKAKLITLIVTPMITGSISSIASLTMIINIYGSNLKLSTIYRRLIFMMSAFDIVQSVANAISTAPMPAGVIWGAIGNEKTCNAQGFMNVFGLCGVLFYNLALTIYFLLIIKFKMPEQKIKKFAEPFLHAMPLLYAFVSASYVLAANTYGTAGTVCWISDKPKNCYNDPEVECVSRGNPYLLKWILGGGPVYAVFILNCIMMVVIWREVAVQIKKRNATFNGEESQRIRSCCCASNFTHSQFGSANSPRFTSSPLTDRLSRPSRAALTRQRDISNRALAYVVANFCTFVFSAIYRLLEAYGSGTPPFAIIFLARFFWPLQGLFNVFVYTYPHVITYRRNHSHHGWIRAFWEVVKSGGDHDEVNVGRSRASRRRSSIRKLQKVLEQSENRVRNLTNSRSDTAEQRELDGVALNFFSTRLNLQENADVVSNGEV